MDENSAHMSTDDQLRTHSDRVVDTLLDSLRRNDMRAFADQWAPDGIRAVVVTAAGWPPTSRPVPGVRGSGNARRRET